MASGMPGTPDPAMKPLRVARAEAIAEDIHLFELRDPSGADLGDVSAGSPVWVRVPHRHVRKYSLCNDPAERDRYLIAVKREPMGGRGGSERMIRDVQPGSELAVSAP